MTIHQLPEPCFELTPNPWDEDDYSSPHYATEDEAAKALAELREERADDPEGMEDLREVQPRLEPVPCWAAECDGPDCDETFEDDEDGASHYVNAESLMECLAADGWAYKVPDLVFCTAHSREGEPVPPSPAEQEEAGQLVIPGVLT